MSSTEPYSGPERRNRSRTHEDLVASIVEALEKTYTPQCLTEDEQKWVRMAIKVQADRAAIRKAIIEKSLAGLVWAALLAGGTLIMDGLKLHGWK